MAMRMRKTIIVGLGGTGLNALLYMKREFQDHCGSIPRVVQLLCFDTDTIDQEIRDSNGNPVELVGHEFTYTPVRDPVSVLEEYPEVRREFPEGRVHLRALLSGAGQVRACGRLALLANASDVYRRLEDAYAVVTAASTEDEIRASKDFDLSTDQQVTIYVVCSLAGGTGAGVFLDVAYLARNILDTNDRLIGIFLLPTIFTSYPATQFVRGNAYASLLELDHLMERASTQAPKDVVEYGPDLKVDWARYYPFDQVYLLDNKNEEGVRFNALDQVQRFIGRALFVNTNVVAERGDDVMDNLAGADAISDPWNGKRPNYASFGAAAVELPIQKILTMSVLDKVAELIGGGLLSSDKTRIEDDVTSFTEQAKVAELGKDDVIDTLIPPRVLQPARFDDAWRQPDPARAIQDWCRRELQTLEDRYEKLADENYATKLAEAKTAVAQKIESSLMGKGGVDYARAFVRSLAIRLTEDRTMMEQERSEHELTREGVKNEYPEPETIERACRGYFSRPRIEKLVATLQAAMERESELQMEVIRRSYAINLFAELIALAREYQATIERIVETLDAASADVSRRIKRVEGQKEVNSFTKHLDATSLSSEIEALSREVTIDFALQVMKSAGESLLLWAGAEWDASRVVDRLCEIVFGRYQLLRDQGMERVLSNLSKQDPSRLNGLLKSFLVDRATPLWKYNQDIASRRGLTEILIFGVQNEGDSILQELRSSDFGVSARRVQYASTGNKYSVSAFKYKLRVPAYVLDGIDDLQQEYRRREDRADYTYHTRRVWADNPEMLGDLIPQKVVGTEDQRMYWAVAFSEPFKLIWDAPGGHYYIRSERVGEPTNNFTTRLGQGRSRAYEEFTAGEHSNEYFEELKETIDRIVSEKGAESVVENLHEYCQEISELTEDGKIGKEIQVLLNDEFKAIERFVRRITTKH